MTYRAFHAYCDTARAVPVQNRLSITLRAITVRDFAHWVERAFAVHRQRRRLMRLNDRQLQDIGIARQEAKYEASRPFWDLP